MCRCPGTTTTAVPIPSLRYRQILRRRQRLQSRCRRHRARKQAPSPVAAVPLMERHPRRRSSVSRRRFILGLHPLFRSIRVALRFRAAAVRRLCNSLSPAGSATSFIARAMMADIRNGRPNGPARPPVRPAIPVTQAKAAATSSRSPSPSPRPSPFLTANATSAARAFFHLAPIDAQGLFGDRGSPRFARQSAPDRLPCIARAATPLQHPRLGDHRRRHSGGCDAPGLLVHKAPARSPRPPRCTRWGVPGW